MPFSIFGAKEKTTSSRPPSIITPTPQSPPPPPPVQSKAPAVPQRPEIVHHSTLLLLEKNGLSQEPRGYWDGKMIFETPPSKNEKGRSVFEPESAARQAENRQRRVIKKREAEREERAQEEGWLEGQAQLVAKALFDLECVDCDLREASRWSNILMEVREHRKANARSSWFGKEAEDERKYRLAADAGLRSVRALEWTREFEPQTVGESSAASIRSSRRISGASFMSLGTNRDPRLSMLSTLTTSTRSTARSSIFSMHQGGSSTISSPISSGIPSPVLSIKEEEEWPEHEEEESPVSHQAHALPTAVLSR